MYFILFFELFTFNSSCQTDHTILINKCFLRVTKELSLAKKIILPTCAKIAYAKLAFMQTMSV